MKAFIQHAPNTVISDKMVLQALLPFTLLNSKAIFTQKSLSNEIVNKENLMDVEGNAVYYQRSLDKKRLRDLQEYIYNSILDEKDKIAVSLLFPTSMILSIKLNDLPINFENGIIDIDFDNIDKIYIVDGQHRLMAMRLFYKKIINEEKKMLSNDNIEYIKKYLNEYKFNCTILVNYDIWEQSQVFVNVNFKQKPVNRSLYYDVFGAEYIDSDDKRQLMRNKIYLAHEITRFLNEVPKSPFRWQIKMLGTGSGYVSQAFFVETILPLFKNTGIWYYDPSSPPTKLNAYKSEIFNFYCVIEKCFKDYWGEKDKKVHFICKTTGIGALTRLMATLHNEIDCSIIRHMENVTPGEESEEYRNSIEELLKPIIDCQEELLGDRSQFAGTGGKGLENNFFKEMLRILNNKGKLSNKTIVTYKDDFKEFKENISKKNRQELKEIGIVDIEERIERYMNRNLPSEIIELGNICSVEEIDNLFVNKINILNERSISIWGTFSCKVKIAYERNDEPFIYNFPGIFTLRINRTEDNWAIDDDNTKIYVETDSYYK